MPAGIFLRYRVSLLVFWVFFDFSTCEEEYMSGFSLLDQRQWIQSERQRMEFLGTLHLFYVRGGIWSLMEWFFLSAQLVVETVEESVRGSASWVSWYLTPVPRARKYFCLSGGGGGAVRRLMSM